MLGKEEIVGRLVIRRWPMLPEEQKAFLRLRPHPQDACNHVSMLEKYDIMDQIHTQEDP